MLEFTVSQDPRVSVWCILVNIRFLVALFKEGAGNDFIWPSDRAHPEWWVVGLQPASPTRQNLIKN